MLNIFYQAFSMLIQPGSLPAMLAGLIGAVGVDRGSGFEQLEAAPEYSKQGT